MLPVRVAFDVSLPVVASQAFTAAGRSFRDGDAVPWRELGIDERDLYAFWTSGLVRFEMLAAPAERIEIAPAVKRRASRHATR